MSPIFEHFAPTFGKDEAPAKFGNPATGKITLFSELQSSISYIIFDGLGREVVKGQFTNRMVLDISGYDQGIYTISFQTDSGSTNQKLILSK